MITSTLGRMADADKLSVMQLKQAVQNGTVPAYIGIPLIQEKMKQSQQMQIAQAAQAPRQVPIADQILQQSEGIPELPSNLPMQYAHGGIIHMAMGGYDPLSMAKSFVRDDEDTDDMDYLSALGVDSLPEAPQSMEQRAEPEMEMPEETGIAALTPATQLAYAAPFATSRQADQVTVKKEGEPAQTVRQETARVERPAAARDFERLALAEAEKYKLDPSLVKHVMFKETGNLKDKANAVSPAGAVGVMQLMPATARELGVKDPYDPVQNIEGGIKYLAKMQRKYDDPRLAAIAYNWGPGNTDRWLAKGGDFNKLPRETQGYIRGLAQGGSVQHYDDGGKTSSDDNTSFLDKMFPPLAGGKPNPLREALRFKTYTPEPGTVEAEGITYNVVTPPKNAPAQAPGISPYTDTERLLRRYPNLGSGRGPASAETFNAAEDAAGKTREYVPPETPAYAETEHLARLFPPTGQLSTNATDIPPVEAPVAEAAAQPEKDDLRDYFAKGIASLEDQKKINAYMALLSAGLGMMGGTSRHALTNIGTGAQQGVQTYQTGAKDIATQQNALMQGRLGLEKYQSLRDIQKQQMQNLAEYRQDRLANQQAEHDRRVVEGREKTSLAEERLALARIKNLDEALARKEAEAKALALAEEKNAFTPEQHQQIQARAVANLHKRPDYQQLYKLRYGELPMGAQTQANLSQADADLVNKYLPKK